MSKWFAVIGTDQSCCSGSCHLHLQCGKLGLDLFWSHGLKFVTILQLWSFLEESCPKDRGSFAADIPRKRNVVLPWCFLCVCYAEGDSILIPTSMPWPPASHVVESHFWSHVPWMTRCLLPHPYFSELVWQHPLEDTLWGDSELSTLSAAADLWRCLKGTEALHFEPFFPQRNKTTHKLNYFLESFPLWLLHPQLTVLSLEHGIPGSGCKKDPKEHAVELISCRIAPQLCHSCVKIQDPWTKSHIPLYKSVIALCPYSPWFILVAG